MAMEKKIRIDQLSVGVLDAGSFSISMAPNTVPYATGTSLAPVGPLLTGEVLGGVTGGPPEPITIAGHPGRISVDLSTPGVIRLSTPQDTGTASAVTFDTVTATTGEFKNLTFDSAPVVSSFSAGAVVSSATGALSSLALADDQLAVGVTGAAPVPRTLLGTTNRISVNTWEPGVVRLATPQDIGADSDVTFGSVSVGTSLSSPALVASTSIELQSLSTRAVVVTGTNGVLAGVTPSAGQVVIGTGGALVPAAFATSGAGNVAVAVDTSGTLGSIAFDTVTQPLFTSVRLGAAGTASQTIVSGVPTTAGQTITIPNVGTSSSVILSHGEQAVVAQKTFQSVITSDVGVAFRNGASGNTYRVRAATTPAASRVYGFDDIPDTNFAMLGGAQMFDGAKTFSGAVSVGTSGITSAGPMTASAFSATSATLSDTLSVAGMVSAGAVTAGTGGISSAGPMIASALSATSAALSGTLSVAGAVSVGTSGITSAGPMTASALSATSATLSGTMSVASAAAVGSLTVASDASVVGALSAGSFSVGTLSAISLALSGTLSVAGSASVGGLSTLGPVSAGAVIAAHTSGGIGVSSSVTGTAPGTYYPFVGNNTTSDGRTYMQLQSGGAPRVTIGWESPALGIRIFDNSSGSVWLHQGTGGISGYVATLNNILDTGSGAAAFSGAVTTASNTLDDGIGNASFFGFATAKHFTPLAILAYSGAQVSPPIMSPNAYYTINNWDVSNYPVYSPYSMTVDTSSGVVSVPEGGWYMCFVHVYFVAFIVPDNTRFELKLSFNDDASFSPMAAGHLSAGGDTSLALTTPVRFETSGNVRLLVRYDAASGEAEVGRFSFTMWRFG